MDVTVEILDSVSASFELPEITINSIQYSQTVQTTITII